MERFIYKKRAGITVLSASFSDFIYKKHCHEEYAFGVTQRGVQQYHLNGSLESSYPHGVMLFNPEQIHDGRAQDTTGIDYAMLYIQPALLLEVTGKKEVFCFRTPIVYNYKLEQSIVRLAQAVFHAAEESLCSELLLTFADHFTEIDVVTAVAYKKEDALIKKAKEMIHCSVGNVLHLDDICRELNISKFKFIRMFKAHTGFSPYQYFLNRKVSLAKRLIESQKDIYAAVADCGFVDLSHLNRHFRSIYGTTAHAYLNET